MVPRVWVAAGLVAVSLWAPSARAEPSAADIATARELANEGLSAQDAGDYATAEDRFRRASELYAAPTVLLGLARAQAKLGKLVEARESYRRIVRMKLSAQASEAFVEAQNSASVEIEQLEPRLAWLTVSASEQPKGLRVTLDGAPLPLAAIGARRPLNPGSHTLHAIADGHAPFEASFAVNEGQAQVLDIALTPRGDEAEAGGAPWRTLGLVAIGVGAAGLVVGAVTGGIAVSKDKELAENCLGGRCEADQYDNLDSFRLTSTISTASFIAGGVLAAAGLTLVLVDVAGDDAHRAALSLGPGGLSMKAAWR